MLVIYKIGDLQCCVNLRFTEKWFSYTYIHFFQILFPYRLLWDWIIMGTE